MHTTMQVRDFLEPVAQCTEGDALGQVLDKFGARNPVAIHRSGRWRVLVPEAVAAYSPSRRVIDLPLAEACLVSPDLLAQDALTRLIDGSMPYALVVEDDRLLGMVTRKRLLASPAVSGSTQTDIGLSESEAQYRSLFENSLDGVLLTTPDGRILAANREACRIFGRTEEELRRVGRAGVVDGTDPRLAALLMERSRAGRCRGELTLLRADGTAFEAEISSAIFTEGDGALRTSMIIRDITERKRSEETLRRSEADLAEAQRIAKVGSWNFDFDTNEVRWSEELFRIFDIEKSGFGGTYEAFLNRVHPDDRPRVRESNSEAIAGKDSFEVEYRVMTQSGEVKTIREIGYTRKDPAGKVVALFGTAQDISERKRAEEVLLARTHQLETIRAVTAEITRELDPTALLRLIIQRAAELVGVASGTVWLWEEEAQRLVPVAWHGSSEWRDRVRLRLGEGVAGTAARRREGLLVNDYRTSPYALPFFLDRTDVTAVMAEPLMYRERLLGVLMIDNTGSWRLFTAQDRETLALFASQAAIAIENARLHSDAVRRAAELKSLLQANQTITSGLDLQAILDRIAAEATQIAGTSHVRVMLLDREAQVLRVAAQRGQALGHPTMPLESLSGRTAQTGQPVFRDNVRDDPGNLFFEEDRALGIVTHLSLPIKSRDAILGVLTFNTTGPRQYSPHELAYLASFADQAAIAIENARLFQSVSDQHVQLQTLTARLADAGETQRERLSRELHDCVGGNLTALNLSLSIIQSQLQAQDTASATARIEECTRLTEETVQHIRSVMIELRPPLLDDQGLVASLRWYADQFASRTAVNMAVRGEEPRPRLSRSAEIALFRIAQEALTNVAKHAQAREVALMLVETAEQVRLEIIDDGVGFDPATVRPRGKQPWWGLITMRERAVAIGGSLRVESAPGSGTRVIVEIPR